MPKEGDRPNIYWAAFHFHFGKRGAYAGIQHQGNRIINGVPFKYNNIFSVWDLKDTESHLPSEVQLTY